MSVPPHVSSHPTLSHPAPAPTAGTGSRHFYLFDTQRWRWARWELPPGGGVAAAAWAPPCASRPPVLLAALAGGGAHAVALHLVDAPPGLTAQLLPVALPGLGQGSSGGSGGTGPGTGPPGPGAGAEGSPAGGIVDMAWDARGERLAVLLGQPHAQVGGWVEVGGRHDCKESTACFASGEGRSVLPDGR